MKPKKKRTLSLNKKTVAVLTRGTTKYGGAKAIHPTVITTTIITATRTMAGSL